MSSKRGPSAEQKKALYKVTPQKFAELVNDYINQVTAASKFLNNLYGEKGKNGVRPIATFPNGKTLSLSDARKLFRQAVGNLRTLPKYHAMGKQAVHRVENADGTYSWEPRTAATRKYKVMDLLPTIAQNVSKLSGLYQRNNVNVSAAASGKTSRADLLAIFYSFFDMNADQSTLSSQFLSNIKNLPLIDKRTGKQKLTKDGKPKWLPNSRYNLDAAAAAGLDGFRDVAAQLIQIKRQQGDPVYNDVSTSSFPLTRVQTLITVCFAGGDGAVQEALEAQDAGYQQAFRSEHASLVAYRTFVKGKKAEYNLARRQKEGGTRSTSRSRSGPKMPRVRL